MQQIYKQYTANMDLKRYVSHANKQLKKVIKHEKELKVFGSTEKNDR